MHDRQCCRLLANPAGPDLLRKASSFSQLAIWDLNLMDEQGWQVEDSFQCLYWLWLSVIVADGCEM